MKVLVIGGTLFIGRQLVEELVKGGHEVAVLHRKPKHDFGRRVENIMADRNDAACHARSPVRRAGSTWFSTMCTTGSAAPPRSRWRPRCARPATGITPLHFHVERGGLRRRVEPQGERSAGAGLPPRSVRAPQGDHGAAAVPHALAERAAGGDVPAAVRLRAEQSVLPRAVLLGPAARRAADHHPRRRPPADAVRLRHRPGASRWSGRWTSRARWARRSISATRSR